MPTPAHVLSHLGDVARGTELHRFGLSRRMLSAAVREGAILRVRNGVFALPSTCSDTVGAAAHGGALTCSRALRMHGVWTLDDDEHPHVWMGTHGRTHHSGCACTSHYFDGPTALGLAPLEDALVHVLLCRGDEAFFVALESALRLRKLRAAGRARIRARLPRRARWLVDFARSDADSGLESLLRLRLHLLGILWNARWTSPPSAGSTSWSIGC
nr:type IV toxin-antitoxin system AbiEi family antitoxin domain-containing protein [uncultured Microbacterium sp.]